MSAHELAAEARSPFSPASLACPPHRRACRAQASRITPGNMHLRYVRRADPRSEAEARLDCKRPVVCWWMEGTYNSRMNWPTECAHIDRSGGGWGDATCTCVPHVYYEPCPGVMVYSYTVHSSTLKREIKRVTTAHSVRCATVKVARAVWPVRPRIIRGDGTVHSRAAHGRDHACAVCVFLRAK